VPFLDMPTPDQPLAPHLLPHGLKTLVLVEALPRRAFVVHLTLDEGEFTVRIAPPQPGPQIARVSVEHGVPGRADVTVRSSIGVAAWVRQGVLTFDDARAERLLEIVDGAPRAVQIVRAVFGWT
jgi:hypothetical protein